MARPRAVRTASRRAPRTIVIPDHLIAKFASEAGFKHDARSNDPGTKISELHAAVAIALAESGGNAVALRRLPDGTAVHGLWQIKSTYNPQLFDPRANAAAAFAKFTANGRRFGNGPGTGTAKLWSTYPARSTLFLLRAKNAIRKANIGVGIASRLNPFDEPGGFLDLLPAYLKIVAGAWGLTATALVMVYMAGKRAGVTPAVSEVARVAVGKTGPGRALRATSALVPGAAERAVARGEATRQRAEIRREVARARVVTTERGNRQRVRISSSREGRKQAGIARLAEAEHRETQRAVGRAKLADLSERRRTRKTGRLAS